MAITRDPDFPAEIAQLMAAFARCADGHDTMAVLEASANMLIAAIHGHTRMADGSIDDALSLARQIGADLPDHVSRQWSRQVSDDDVAVLLGGN